MENAIDTEAKEAVKKRLNRIEGQIRGISKMIEEDQYCGDILIQVSAAKAALNKVAGIILEKHSMKCMENLVSSEDRDQAMLEFSKALQSLLKFSD